MDFSQIRVSPDNTYHLYLEKPLYSKRFDRVMSFHEPGVAAVLEGKTAYHINIQGEPVYEKRFLKTFGFYEMKAAVQDDSGYYHIDISGNPLYTERYSWVGNFQEGLCVVKDQDGRYFHISGDGKPAYNERYQYAGDFKYGVASVYASNGLSTHIYQNGALVHGHWYLECNVYHKGYAIARDHDGYYHVDMTGNAIYSERYAWVEPFYNGYALVGDHNGRVLTIDEDGHITNIVAGDDSVKVRQQARNDLMSMLVGYWETQILHSLVKSDLLEKIMAGNDNTKKLKTAIFLPETSVDMLLKVAILWGLILEKNNTYYLTGKGRLLTESENNNLKYAALLWGEEHYLAMSGLYESLQNIRPYFKEMFGCEYFDYCAKDPYKSDVYNRAMEAYSIDYDPIINLYDFSKVERILDIGGGRGHLVKKILQNYPAVRQAIIIDLPSVIEEARVNLKGFPQREKIKLMQGDFFETITGVNADTVVLSRVLHDWDDDRAIKILKNISNCLTKNWKLIIFEMVVPDNHKTDMGTTLNFNLLVMVGGKERTINEFNDILQKSGYKINEVKQGGSIIGLIIAEKVSY